MTTIGIVVPTIGRPTLERTLRGLIAAGVRPQDDILVIGDAHQPLPADLAARVGAFGAPFRYIPYDAGFSFKGLYQANVGFAMLRTDLVLSHADDDFFLPRAFDRLRALGDAHPECPILFRAVSPRGNPTWDLGDRRLVRNRMSGSCLAMPRRFWMPYRYPPRAPTPSVDYNWLIEVLDAAARGGCPPVWCDDILVSQGRGVTRLRVA